MMRTLCKLLLSLLVIFSLAGCNSSSLAPVSEVRYHAYTRYPGIHVVSRGETLYSIAFRYDSDYRLLAQVNHLRPPYGLRVGQRLKIKGGGRKHYTVPPKRRTPKYAPPRPKYTQSKSFFGSSFSFPSLSGWTWPVSGRVVTGFAPQQGKKGINIASVKGEKVHAAYNGVVAYAGSGLSGYGNLIIIKHNNEYLTAYGHNAANLVKEGQHVRAGQVIAEVGVVQHKYYGVHFEIRKAGKPVNPLSYLKRS